MNKALIKILACAMLLNVPPVTTFNLAIAEYDSLSAAMSISNSAISAQTQRMKIISENIANSDTTSTIPGGDPYQRKQIYFEQKQDPETGAMFVSIKKVDKDKTPYKLVYEPAHPSADERGIVKYPNVDTAIENIDAKVAQQSIEANISAYEVSKRNADRILGLMSK